MHHSGIFRPFSIDLTWSPVTYYFAESKGTEILGPFVYETGPTVERLPPFSFPGLAQADVPRLKWHLKKTW